MTADASSTTAVESQSPVADEKWTQRFDRRCPRGRVMLLLAILVLALNVTSTLRVDEVSQIDEQYWIDHLLRGAEFKIPRTGDPILQEAVREKCARGVQNDPFVPDCEKGHLNPRKYVYW